MIGKGPYPCLKLAAMNAARDTGKIDSALVALQGAATPDEVWSACDALIRAMGAAHHTLLGLPSLGIMPIFLRTTVDLPDAGDYFARLAQVAPLTQVIMTQPGITVSRMSDSYTATSEFQREFMDPIGWRYSTAMLFWDMQGAFLGQLSAIRSEAQGDYTDEEIAHWKELYPHVNGAIRRLFVLERAMAAQLSLEHLVSPLPLPMVTVGWDLKLNFANNAARDAITAWVHGEANARALKPSQILPVDLRQACLTLKETWNESVRTDTGAPTRSLALEHTTTSGFRAVIQIVETGAGRSLQPSFTILFHLPPARLAEVGHALGHLTKLTRSEQQVARIAAAGCTNIEISQRLGISLNTVRAHLRHVFEKLGITTRGRLAPLHAALQSLDS